MTYIGIASFSLAASLSFGAFKLLHLWERVRLTQQANHRLTSELRTAKTELANRDAQLKHKDDIVSTLRSASEKAQRHSSTLEHALEIAERARKDLTEKNRVLESRVLHLTEAVHAQTVEYEDAQQLLAVRTQELSGAQIFLSKADTLSGADVIGMVETLNAEIMQLGAHMAESFAPLFEGSEPNTQAEGRRVTSSSPASSSGSYGMDELAVVKTPGDDDDFRIPRTESPEQLLEAEIEAKDAMAQALEVFGPTMVDLLQRMNHSRDPILLQFAFQGGMSAYTHWIISSWFFEDPEDEVLLSEVYARVREAEEQAVSGRWRALTRQHVQRMMRRNSIDSASSGSPSPSRDVSDLAIYMVDALVNVLLISGLKDLVSSETGVPHTHTSLHDKIISTFSSQLHVILAHAKRINTAVGESVTSCDLEALYIAPDVLFNDETMEDASGVHDATPNSTPVKSRNGKKVVEGGKGKRSGQLEDDRQKDRVLCTTDLGLVRAEKIPSTRGEWKESVLLKPKVILVSGIQEMLSS
ncbi:hypothetical protein FA15DRAFT_681565 [Coprinopsis marcescibilis]|uniref:Uncharacterized protein n=1 Tax=Coprinopsis marcescibilis TaxID=230819 RepID=A0A5C3KQG5_COPMA|nr:hypothetical protein FA15DRAFT_681565 [Coprinopsis marcescibilis]